MTTDQFWDIIQATTAATQEEQLEKFRYELQQLALPELAEFIKHFAQLKNAAYNWDLWVVVWLCQGGLCSDDSFSDFRSWLIASGRAFYEAALADPDSLVDTLSQIGDPTFESFGYVPGQCWRERSGSDDPPGTRVKFSPDPAGGNWLRPQLKDRSQSKMLNRCVVFREMGDEEIAAIEQTFPRTWKYCLETGKISLRKPGVPSDNLATPEEIARSKVDPNLAKTDFAKYVTLLAQAAREEYEKRRTKS